MQANVAVFFRGIPFLIILLSAPALAQEEDWVHLPGPTGGTMQSFAAVDDAIIAAPRLGAYFRSTDAGRSWQLLFEEKWTRNTIALHATSDDMLFALSTRDVFRSSDGGAQWDPCEIGEIALYIASATDGTVLLGLRGAVAVSTDQGESWERSYPVQDGNRDFKVAVDDAGNWYAGAYQTGLFRSTDRGASWESIDDALPNDVVYSVSVSDGNMLHAGLNNATFRSSDQGETWE
ncbi:MAG: hypothetical protein KFH87_05315, partial [Bacteroidetes bacterium]|nr:hypothetical protein [Bacteroidota bacterium]